ncbi:MAG: dihydrodipicolinate synthase family protein [Sciscionella sp.]
MTSAGDEPVFTGVGVALVTLFDATGEVDTAATAEHAARLVAAGVRAVVTAGTTGEAATLEPAERIAVLTAVRAAVSVPVIAGTGAPSTRQAVRLTADAVDADADGVLALSPPGSIGLPEYYAAVAEAAGALPVLGYHFPTSSAPGIDIDELGELDLHGMKDSSGDPERLLVELDHFGGRIYPGSSALLSFAGPLGCPGAILALANIAPKLCVAAFDGDAGAQRQLLDEHLIASGGPRRLKQVIAERFGTSPVCRV